MKLSNIKPSNSTDRSPRPQTVPRLAGMLVLVWLAFLTAARAVDPPPDGGYPNGNTAEGDNALLNLTTGTDNTAIGNSALLTNMTGRINTAIGFGALQDNTSGAANTATGVDALASNTTGNNNTADGEGALQNNNADNNTADGVGALFGNSTGTQNTASGAFALDNNTTGNGNTADGANALGGNSTGSNNVALGLNAGLNLTAGSNNIMIGAGVLGTTGDANKIRIGKSTHTATFIGGIYGKSVSSSTIGGGVPVLVDSTGKLGTVKSSARFKEAIKPMAKASEAILALEPVTFCFKQELDPDGVTQFGLIAEQVEKVSPELVIRDEDNKVSTVCYEAVNAMLLNEFLKEHRKVQTLETTVAQQQRQIARLTAGLQKVSERVELNRTTARLTAGNR